MNDSVFFFNLQSFIRVQIFVEQCLKCQRPSEQTPSVWDGWMQDFVFHLIQSQWKSTPSEALCSAQTSLVSPSFFPPHLLLLLDLSSFQMAGSHAALPVQPCPVVDCVWPSFFHPAFLYRRVRISLSSAARQPPLKPLLLEL